MSRRAGSPSSALTTVLRTLPTMGGMVGVLTMGLPSASVSPRPATPTFSTLAATSPASTGALKPVRSAVAIRRLRRYEAWAASSVTSSLSPSAMVSSVM